MMQKVSAGGTAIRRCHALAAALAISFALASLSIANLAHATPRHLAVPGGVAVLTVPAATQSASYRDNPVLLTTVGGRKKAFVGLALASQPGRHHLDITLAKGETRQIAFTVKDKDYPTQHVTIADQGKVDLSPENETRVARELAEITAHKKHFRPLARPDIDFAAPADGPLSGRFGARRVFNDKPRNPHSGLDFAVAAGSPIKSAGAGIVLATADYFFNGQTVFVDHGQGLISMYNHLERIDVKPGQKLARGALVGTAGSTGRASGPHLHWSVMLNGNMVDPEVFIPSQEGSGTPAAPRR